MDGPIRIRGARQHNLKNLDLDIPRAALTVITGPSGSGKSSLALDTLFAAGQRRYVEALSTYAKQFLDRLEKPDVDRIEGLSPAVAIEQRNPATSSRSTVGTATEVHDFLRLLYARVGRLHCPECGAEVRADTVAGAVDRVAALPPGERLMIAFPLRRSGRASHRTAAENLRALGFARVLCDGVAAELSELLAPDARPGEGVPDLAAAREVMVVVDRVKVAGRPGRGWRERVADSLATCFREGEGEAMAVRAGAGARRAGGGEGRGGAADGADRADGGGREGLAGRGGGAGAADADAPEEPVIRFTEALRCPRHPDVRFVEPAPKLFSFNNPYGSCPECTGFGANLEYDPELIVPDRGLSLDDGAVDPWAKPRYGRERDALRRFAAREGVSVHAPWGELPEDFRRAVMRGKGGFQGVMAFLASKEPKRYKQYIRIFLRRYQRPRRCGACGGKRLRPEALRATVGGLDLGEVCEMPVEELPGWLAGLELRPMEARVAAGILRELRGRIGFLIDVGLGYLALGRQARTLSGGEAQRIALANSLGSRLVDALYVLDEPSVGLHPRDVAGLLALLERLRDGGNTVVVVEHSAAAIRAADHVVELGPGAGDGGGEVVFAGTPGELEGAETGTGRYLARGGGLAGGHGAGGGGAGDRRRPVDGARVRLRGAALHNLRGVDAEFPVGAMTVVTGVSGSGKSTLVHDVLYRALERELGGGRGGVGGRVGGRGRGRGGAKAHLGEEAGTYESLTGLEHVDGAVLIDQSPIGRTPRSNPATYVKAWGEVRRIFAAQAAARAAGLKARDFSFNVRGGRCEACAGAGAVRVEMVFMADIHARCEDCGGKRYGPEALEVKVRGRSVSDVLDFTVDRAMRFFARERKLGQALWQLQRVGLGYLRLGQPATHLSGGEAQRLKIARELIGAADRKGSRKLYVFDEPTTGLSGEDVAVLLEVLGRLTRAGNTLVVVEHDLDVVRAADWVVDMGPGAGARGGEVVAMGRPEEVAGAAGSVTGRYLAAGVAGAVAGAAGVSMRG